MFIAIFGFSIGFAAYSRNLEISDIEGTVQPGDAELDIIIDDDQKVVGEFKGMITKEQLLEALQK